MKRITPLFYLSFLLLMVFVCLPVPGHAESGTCGENITWTYEKGGLFISGTGEMDTTPPGHIAGATRAPWYDLRDKITYVVIEPGITSISSYAFWHCHALITVTIPDTVTTIGESAFNECWALENIHLPSGITEIPKNAFTNCSSLAQLTLPENLETIGDSAFQGCQKLSDIVLPQTLHSIGAHAFSGCASLTEIVIPDAITFIPDYAFCGCSALHALTLPANLQNIGDFAFSSCNSLPTLTLPPTVKKIEMQAFGGCSALRKVYISDLAAWCQISYDGYIRSNPLLNGASLYLNGEMITDLVIPEEVTRINMGAFTGCRGLRSVTLPEGRTNIPMHLFQSCPDLTTVTIPSTVTEIQSFAFDQCPNLTTVIFCGKMQQLSQIQILGGNDPLLTATWTLSDPLSIVRDVAPKAIRNASIVQCVVLGIQLLIAFFVILRSKRSGFF